jgi:hypothetical protein
LNQSFSSPAFARHRNWLPGNCRAFAQNPMPGCLGACMPSKSSRGERQGGNTD